MTHFKPARNKQDYKAISDLAKEIWTEHYTPIIGIDQVNYMLEKFQSKKAIKSQILDDNYQYFSLINNNTFLGYLSIKKEEDKLFLSKIYIMKSFRGQGFGKISMDFIETQAKDLNCSKIYLTVNKHNINSINAYKKIGFIKIEELIIDIGNGYVMDDYKMEKILIN
ncbi:MAG: GNAT family N-acetyltransferase [Bacteroidetes bacterium]|nr:MAG: GNAT family N-acetyltransferase [Bacteroidota bacterium]